MIVNLSNGTVEQHLKVDACWHGPVDDEEAVLAEKICLEDPRVQAEIAKLKLPVGSVIMCDPWSA